jgi:hypothetical protein
MWLRADAGVIASGNAVSQWQDQSGNGVHASQSAAGNQPTLAAAGVNGRPALQFDGIGDFLTFPLPLNGLGGMTLCLVGANTTARTGGSSGAENAAIFWNEAEPWGSVYLTPFQDRVQFRFGTKQEHNWPTYSRPTTLGNAASINIATKNGATDSLYVNGALVLQQGGKLNTIAATDEIGNLGRGFDDNSYFPGTIAEVLVYRRALSDQERMSLEAYLQEKYSGAAPEEQPTIRIAFTQGQVRGQVNGQANKPYDVLASSDFATWTLLLTDTTGSDGTFAFPVTAQSSRQFFRARVSE